MDEELRALVREVAADPLDAEAGSRLARLLERREGAASSPRAIPPELAPGSAALVFRRTSPRRGFAWRPFMDGAIGRAGVVRALARDGLSAEIEVPGVGRFHAGAASLFAIPEASIESLRERGDEASAPGEPEEVSIEEAARLTGSTSPRESVVEDAPGELGEDGFTETQRALLAEASAPEGTPLAVVAERAGFVPENNRSPRHAFAVLFDLAAQNQSVRWPLVTLDAPALLPGAVLPGPLDTGRWGLSDLLVAPARGAEVARVLPWALVAGLRAGAVSSPPHEAGEVADALVKLLESPRADLDALLPFLPGPDFTGGGEVGSEAAIRSLYETGEGTLRLRASLELELPSKVVIATPFLEDASVFRRAIEAALRSGRLERVAAFRESHFAQPCFEVEVERGADLVRVRKALLSLLPLEQEVRFSLPAPLLEWLRGSLASLARAAKSDGLTKRRLVAVRSFVQDGGRRTRIA